MERDEMQYSEVIAEEGDAEGKALAAFADGNPYVFVVCAINEDESLSLRVASEHSVGTIRAILNNALRALPDE